MSRPFVEMRLDPRKLTEGFVKTYLLETIYEMFVKLHRDAVVEPSVGRGYVAERTVAGFDFILRLTVFESEFEAENVIRAAESFFGYHRGTYFVLEKSTVQEYIEKMNAGHSDKVEEEPVRLN